MNLIPWKERVELASFRSELEKFLDSFFDGGERFTRLPDAFRRTVLPALNVAESDKDYCVSVELPGVDERDLQVQLLGDQLVISGERKWEREKKGRECHRVESQYGSFRRAVVMPDDARREPDSITATYTKGMLEVHVPKVEPRPAARIQVKAQ